MYNDSFEANIEGARNLVEAGINKTNEGDLTEDVGQKIDVLDLPMTDEELLDLKREYENAYSGYYPKIKTRQEKNKLYYAGKQRGNGSDPDKTVSSNLIFEAEETFIPQSLAKNPEPVVWSDNTEEGKSASSELKTMLQYHADVLCLRRKLGVMVRQWSIYYLGVIKHGWDSKLKDIKLDLRRPQNFLLDPNGYVDEYGNFIGWLGERIELTAEELIKQFPSHKAYILIKCSGKLGTLCTITEWWNDEYCFTTFFEEVLDKHKNEFFHYEGDIPNHFAIPKKPYTFLSVFSLQERPHDITNLIEQNVANQDRINDRDDQITRNLRASNNSLVLSKQYGWDVESAREAAQAIEDGDPILAPNEIEKSIKRLPGSPLPSGILEAQAIDKETLRSVFGTQGLTPQLGNEADTARGMILNQNHDSTRIGGGIGDALEQVADNIFNWWTQLYFVFYDEPHYGAIMGNGRAVEYTQIINSKIKRNFVVSVSPNSMQPKDEVSEMNQAVELWNAKALDPITLFKKLNYADPMETAKQVSLWNTNPQLYMQTYFPEKAPPQGAPPMGLLPPQPGSPPENPSAPPASASLSQVPISTNQLPK